MKMTPQKRKRLTIWLIGVSTAIILIFLGVQNIGVLASAVKWCLGLVSSLIVGLAMALIVNVPMRFFESLFWKNATKPILNRIRRPLAYIVSLLVIIGILAGVIGLIVPQIIEAVTLIVNTATKFVNGITNNQEEILELPFGELLLEIDWKNLLESFKTWLKNESGMLVNTAFGTISALFSGIFDFFVSVAFSIYILFSKEILKRQAKRLVRVWIPARFSGFIIHAFSIANKNFRNFVFGQSLEAVIIGVLCTLGMLIFRFPYATTVGALVGVSALVPVVGAFVGAIVGALLIVTVDPLKAVLFIVYILALQQLEGNVIYPRVMGSKVNLPGLWILAAVTVGGGVYGVVGMLLSVPLASTLYVLMRELTEQREERLGLRMPVIEEETAPIESPLQAEDESTDETADAPTDETAITEEKKPRIIARKISKKK